MNALTSILPGDSVERTRFAVPGMRCAGCIAKLEGGLAPVAGILSARVNFTAKQLTIEHVPTLTLPELQDSIEALGFDAQPIQLAARAEDKESSELLKATAVAGFAAMNIMLLSVSVWSGASGATRDLFHAISALIAIPAIAYSGRPFFRSALRVLRRGRTNMDVPISIGVLLVTGLSLYETLISGPHAYFDGAVMLLFFLLVGRSLDSIMRDRAREGVTALLKQTAPGALVLAEDGTSQWVAAANLHAGMRIIVAVGERFAADGIVEQGRSAIDTSLLTGESAPVSAGEGDAVHAGTMNIDAPLVVRITSAGPDTAIADIARLMEQAAQPRSRYVRFADRAARYYAPAVHTLAALAFVGWMLAGAGWHQAVLIAAAVLIITCPCALGLAVPASQIVAAGALMRAGILVKDGSALERLAEADRALFDKTGTLTLGRAVPTNLAAVRGDHLGVLLALAQTSRHPLSQSLRRALETQGVVAIALADLREVPGSGLTGSWNGQPVSLSRPMATSQEKPAALFTVADSPPVLLTFDDSIRPGAGEMLGTLAGLGIESSIISGDRAQAVAPIARALGLTAQTAMQPTDKLGAIARLQNAGQRVLVVGDGLNDGPALAAGHVSIAPSSASEVGQNAADAVFLGDSLAPVATAVKVARRTMQVVRQNVAIAVLYNFIAVPLALAGLVTPLVAALAMSGSSIIVVGNALRLRSAAR